MRRCPRPLQAPLTRRPEPLGAWAQLQLAVRAAWAVSSWGIMLVVVAGLAAMTATLLAAGRR